MECDKCGEESVMLAAYSGQHLCVGHFCRWVETRVRRRIREDGLVSPSATPEDPDTWVVGLSGGKDSAVLTHILHDTFESDPRIELVALTVHEGIEGYRDASLEACRELVDRREIAHEVVSYAEEFDVRMDDVARDDPEDMAPCAYCGVFRRDVLSRYAEELGADRLLTGHNLDDEAQTAMMNFLEGDLDQIAKHFDASLGGLDERTGQGRDAFVPRAKPLRDVPEKEVGLYAHLRELPAHVTECPHASEAYRGEIRDLLLDLEERHPGTRHSIMSGYEDLARLAAQAGRTESTSHSGGVGGDGDGAGGDGGPGECERCGAPTNDGLCRKCQLLDSIRAE